MLDNIITASDINKMSLNLDERFYYIHGEKNLAFQDSSWRSFASDIYRESWKNSMNSNGRG